MCNWGTNREIEITQRVTVDACLADLIGLLNRAGVHTTGCCCGHGKGPATATIKPSSIGRARVLGYAVTMRGGPDPEIALSYWDDSAVGRAPGYYLIWPPMQAAPTPAAAGSDPLARKGEKG